MPSTMPHHGSTRQLVLPVAVALVIVGLIPGRYLAWQGWFTDLTLLVAAPISGPVSGVTRALAPSATKEDQRSRVQLLEERNRYETLYLRGQRENERLRGMIAQLQQGVGLHPGLAVRQYAAPVIGASTDPASQLLYVRAGTRQGVAVNTVVTARAVQLVGQVRRVSDRTSDVLLITDPSMKRLEGVALLEGATSGPRCTLRPKGDGTLIGDVAVMRDDAGEPLRVSVGDTVRLSDDEWPESAQMLIVGTVELVEPDPDQSLRQVITVRPSMRLSRVREVVLRITGAAEGTP